jgi:hypothetical protein
MECSKCGYDNPEDALACGLCGKVFRKEVREDKEKEHDKQPMSKKERFYAEMKKKMWEKDNKDLPDIIVGAKGVYEMIKGVFTSKGKERMNWILGLFALVIAIVIGVVLDQKFGLRETWQLPSGRDTYWILFIGFIWIFIFLLLTTLFEKFTRKRKG